MLKGCLAPKTLEDTLASIHWIFFPIQHPVDFFRKSDLSQTSPTRGTRSCIKCLKHCRPLSRPQWEASHGGDGIVGSSAPQPLSSGGRSGNLPAGPCGEPNKCKLLVVGGSGNFDYWSKRRDKSRIFSAVDLSDNPFSPSNQIFTVVVLKSSKSSSASSL